MVSRGDWEIEVCHQVLCDLDQRSVPLRKEEGDEILMKLLTMCVMDVFISFPPEGAGYFNPQTHICDRGLHFLFSPSLVAGLVLIA